VNPMTNIAFAGLTAAGKTTHTRQLAADLGYGYVSATEIMLEILRIPNPGAQLWFTRLDEINAARQGDAVDIELERRLEELALSCDRTVFDSWALAWISRSPMVRVWVESDLSSRVRKCLVSLGDNPRPPAECRALLQAKDDANRSVFRRRHGFDLFRDRDQYHAVLCNSHLIPGATEQAARRGIETFAPVVRDAVLAVMADDPGRLSELQAGNRAEVLAIRGMHAGQARRRRG
jgi:cytidylate kinase